MAEPAIPLNPSTAAIMAMIKNVTAQFNIEHSFLLDHATKGSMKALPK